VQRAITVEQRTCLSFSWSRSFSVTARCVNAMDEVITAATRDVVVVHADTTPVIVAQPR